MTDVTSEALFDEREYDRHAAREQAADGCRSLWCAVIIQAVRDVSRHPAGLGGTGATLAAHEADRFLRGVGGNLRAVCGMAGIDADRVIAMYSRGELRLTPDVKRSYRKAGVGRWRDEA